MMVDGFDLIEQEFEAQIAKHKLMLHNSIYNPSSYSLPSICPEKPQKVKPMETLGVVDIIYRLIGHRRYEVKTYIETWKDVGIFHIAVRRDDGQIIRFEESPDKFPSAMLIDKLRLLQ